MINSTACDYSKWFTIHTISAVYQKSMQKHFVFTHSATEKYFIFIKDTATPASK